MSDPPEKIVLRFHDDGSMLLMNDEGRDYATHGTWVWDEPILKVTFARSCPAAPPPSWIPRGVDDRTQQPNP